MEIIGYLAFVVMGVSLGMIGGGGSILTVPIFVYLFQVEPVLATSYSLFVVGGTALFGAGVNHFQGSVDYKTGLLFGLPSFLGMYLTRGFLVPRLPDVIFSLGGLIISKANLVMSVFAVLMLVASFAMMRQPVQVDSSGGGRNKRRHSPWMLSLLVIFEGVLVGGITGFVGAGGGFLIIPALVLLVGLPMKKAVGTSLLIIAVKSFVGFLGDLQSELSMDWSLLIWSFVISLVGLFVGLRFASRVPDKTLKRGFGYFVLGMGVLIFVDQIRKM